MSFTPTWLHFFLVAAPGSWQPATLRSGRPEPSTDSELEGLVASMAADIGTPSQFVRYQGSHCLSSQLWVEPQEESPLIVPNSELIVPPGVQR